MVVMWIISPLSRIIPTAVGPIHSFFYFYSGRNMTTMIPMTTGRNLNLPISDARTR
jgi:hypothetical protein